MIYGYVKGLSGLPAIGSSVIAEDQETGQTTSSFVSLTGQYFLNLTPGTYEIIVSFPNGVTQVIDGLEIARGYSPCTQFQLRVRAVKYVISLTMKPIFQKFTV